MLFQVNGPTTQNVTITTTEDTKLEETETITLSLAPVQNHVVAGGISTTTISIIDDDGNYTISYLCIIRVLCIYYTISIQSIFRHHTGRNLTLLQVILYQVVNIL